MDRRWSRTCALLLSVPLAARAQDDGFIRGYAAAALQRDFEIPPEAVTVQDGVVTVRADLSESERERLTAALNEIDGVARVDLLPGADAPSRWTFLPRRELFQPLIADPRWPHFSAAYQYYIDDRRLGGVAAVSFGGQFPLLQYDLSDNGHSGPPGGGDPPATARGGRLAAERRAGGRCATRQLARRPAQRPRAAGYFLGDSVNGHFLDQHIQYIGLGAQLNI